MARQTRSSSSKGTVSRSRSREHIASKALPLPLSRGTWICLSSHSRKTSHLMVRSTRTLSVCAFNLFLTSSSFALARASSTFFSLTSCSSFSFSATTSFIRARATSQRSARPLERCSRSRCRCCVVSMSRRYCSQSRLIASSFEEFLTFCATLFSWFKSVRTNSSYSSIVSRSWRLSFCSFCNISRMSSTPRERFNLAKCFFPVRSSSVSKELFLSSRAWTTSSPCATVFFKTSIRLALSSMPACSEASAVTNP
mmetsp:Transcript_106832/g.300358  ORF Transcript_106832/g.300358 Transcript_106832/m.300358 type:complete len:254 (-) Transcript_106832:238-999(-)